METKRREYAQAGIPEYWIVDPQQKQIVVLMLRDERYVEAGVYEAGAVARSMLLDGFEVAVADVWEAAQG